ncbi:unnamed protein product [Callosobruchus maculatus]|uniref:Uncharacterized protein n=1 Tax=Callosobruchus maculatus TaxID=64391 RepID=A0A653DDB5_CALMS|nr:unnamed protein product [Callosobruchus maculatus]
MRACVFVCGTDTYMAKYGFGVHESYISGSFAVRSKYVTIFQ